VAVKVLSQSLANDERFRLRFDREARHIASLLHPNIVVVYDSGADDDHLFMVMELVQGRSLRALLPSAAPLSTTFTLTLAADILAGLEHAHAAGIIHRDIKPGNILVTDSDVCKLADFGISVGTAETLNLTDSGAVLGTVTYASPEQISGDPLSPASDLYSMGCVLYECIAGRPPFQSDNLAALVTQQQFGTPDGLERVAPNAPVELTSAIMKVLSKEPTDRFASAGEMARALAAVPTDLQPGLLSSIASIDRSRTLFADTPGVTPVEIIAHPPLEAEHSIPTSDPANGWLRKHRRWLLWICLALTVALLAGGLVLATTGNGPAPPAATGTRTPVLAGVSCSTHRDCVAVGWKALFFNGSSWSQTATTDPSAFLTAVSCTGVHFCVAVDNVGDALSFNGTTWSAPQNIDFSRVTQSISCGDQMLCIAVDGDGNVIRYDGLTWLASENVDSTHFIVDVSCVGTHFCIAVDDRGDALAFVGGPWSAPLSIDSPNELTGISCATTRFCVAVDGDGNATLFTGDAWSSPRSIDRRRTIEAISCISTRFCLAVDGVGDAIGMHGTSWSAPVLIDPGHTLERISCVSAHFCVAVDNAGRELTFNGHSWSPPREIS
jgi:serine/threonine-protein kinase